MIWRNEAGYLGALSWLMTNGHDKKDRTGTGTRSKFGAINMEFDLMRNGYPIVPQLSTKQVLDEKVKVEYDWMMSGSSRLEPLIEKGVHIWDNWVLKGTEVWGALLTIEQRAKKLNKADRAEYEAHSNRAFISDALREQMQTEYLDAKGVHTHKLIGGELGPVYGRQWRDWVDTRLVTNEDYEANREDYWKRGFKPIDTTFSTGMVVIQRRIDQIAEIEDALRTNRDSRRMILNAWNVSYIDEMALPPCHTLVQWAVEPDADGNEVLNCKLYQRSGDMFLGVPFNFLFYSIMTHQLAVVHGLVPGILYHSFGDAHIYQNHFDQVRLQLTRQPSPDNFPKINLPSADSNFDHLTSITQFTVEDVRITGNVHQGFISAPVSV